MALELVGSDPSLGRQPLPESPTPRGQATRQTQALEALRKQGSPVILSHNWAFCSPWSRAWECEMRPQLGRLFLRAGGAPTEDLKALSQQNVSMDLATFMKLRREAVLVGRAGGGASGGGDNRGREGV